MLFLVNCKVRIWFKNLVRKSLKNVLSAVYINFL